MRTFYILLLFISGTLSLSAINCKDVTSNTFSTKDDKVIQEERKVSSFDGIGLSTSGDVKLVQGSPQKVVLEGAASDLEKIETVVEGSKLKIRTKSGTWHVGKVTYYITVENIKELSISGSGSIVADQAVKLSDASFHISGSGNIHLANVKTADNLESHISGSGSITLAGDASSKRHEVHISGSGDVLAGKLQVQEGDIHISGSGNCKMAVSGKLQVRVSGSGDVYYSGKPVIDASISGSGKLRETTF